MKAQRWFRLKMLKIMRLQGDPDLIAKGIALGVSVDFLPTFGLGALFAYLFATLWRVNRIAAVLTSLAFKWLIIPFYAANIMVGRFIMGRPADNIDVPIKFSWSLDSVKDLSDAFFVGSAINAIISGVVVFLISRTLIIGFRERKQKKFVKK
ncbi:MAG: DUF2062 domain-containing protein [Dehalobacterium sp.]